jgi:peroxiredoxin
VPYDAKESATKQHTPPVAPRLPTGLPVPVDDGAAAHLAGQMIPELRLQSADGSDVELAELAAGSLVLYIYPKMGRPDVPDPEGWDEIPGARGCTQESCAFRDRNEAFAVLGYAVAGLSAQPIEEQKEASQRLHLGFPLLADPMRRLGASLKLPTFEAAGRVLYKRLTLVARQRRIVKVFYPVFPPQENPEQVLDWLRRDVTPPASRPTNRPP